MVCQRGDEEELTGCSPLSAVGFWTVGDRPLAGSTTRLLPASSAALLPSLGTPRVAWLPTSSDLSLPTNSTWEENFCRSSSVHSTGAWGHLCCISEAQEERGASASATPRWPGLRSEGARAVARRSLQPELLTRGWLSRTLLTSWPLEAGLTATADGSSSSGCVGGSWRLMASPSEMN